MRTSVYLENTCFKSNDEHNLNIVSWGYIITNVGLLYMLLFIITLIPVINFVDLLLSHGGFGLPCVAFLVDSVSGKY